jgi:hypothetical protein
MKNDCEDERGPVCGAERGVIGYHSGTVARKLRAGLSLLPEGDKCTMANRLRKLSPYAMHSLRLEDGLPLSRSDNNTSQSKSSNDPPESYTLLFVQARRTTRPVQHSLRGRNGHTSNQTS